MKMRSVARVAAGGWSDFSFTLPPITTPSLSTNRFSPALLFASDA